MVKRLAQDLSDLYETDETAWLEAMARLVAERRYDELDHEHLSEYLLDMARRDRQEVLGRLVVLLWDLLKWNYQPDQRSSAWRGSIRSRRRELGQLLVSGTLRKHAEEVLAKAYGEAVAQAVDETELPERTFPAALTRRLDELLDPNSDNTL